VTKGAKKPFPCSLARGITKGNDAETMDRIMNCRLRHGWPVSQLASECSSIKVNANRSKMKQCHKP